jgi:uncharacterized membrane protein HdeD (DUF308 family)
MTAKTTALLTGVLILISGIFIAIFSYNPSRAIQYVVVICSILGGILAILTARNSKGYEINLKYHWLVSIGLILYAIAIAFFANELSSFLQVTSYFLLLFGLVEFIFTFQVLNSRNRFGWNIMLYKLIAGAIAIIGSLLVLTTSLIDGNIALLFSGIIISLIGLSFVLVSKLLAKGQMID